ncbi:MAG: DUF3152 domain-containing protein [Actinomycetaceae bacterium]|nr:DUF3152 domain-containing protein [Actinomycetaceae bacterium]
MTTKQLKKFRPLISGAALILPFSMFFAAIPAGTATADVQVPQAGAASAAAQVPQVGAASAAAQVPQASAAVQLSQATADVRVPQAVVVAANSDGEISMVRYDQDPIEASITASTHAFPNTAETVYLVNPHDPAASAGITAAVKSQRPGPVLFTDNTGAINERIISEIGRLRPKTIIAVGGQASIPTQTINTARDASQTAHNNLTSGNKTPQQVTTQTWDAPDAIHTSIQLAKNLYPNKPRRVYLIDANQSIAAIMPLAAVAGSIGQGPIVLIDEKTTDEVKTLLAELQPEYVVGTGKISSDLLDEVSRDFMKSRYTGSSTTTIALNAASARNLDPTVTTSLVPIDDPASLILAAGTSTGPLIPIAPETSTKEAITTVATANRLTGASSSRFIAIGKQGTRGRIFDPRPTKTLSGGLTSTDVIGKGIGKPTLINAPDGLTTGQGEPFTYTIEIDQGLPVEGEEFSREVSATLNNKHGWGRNFQQINDPTKADTRIILASPNLVDKLCAPLKTMGQTSCNNNQYTAINIERWAYGASPFLQAGGTIEEYRQYVISHEVGHAIGHGHAPCPAPGATAPVMLQQTLNMRGCQTNPWPNP